VVWQAPGTAQIKVNRHTQIFPPSIFSFSIYKGQEIQIYSNKNLK
jgi:hypothetical protein